MILADSKGKNAHILSMVHLGITLSQGDLIKKNVGGRYSCH